MLRRKIIYALNYKFMKPIEVYSIHFDLSIVILLKYTQKVVKLMKYNFYFLPKIYFNQFVNNIFELLCKKDFLDRKGNLK